jgi:hypothetical protein
MSNVATLPVSRGRSDISDELLDACGARLSQSVVIVGSGHVDLLAALCRRGFVCVTCQGSYTGLRRLDTPVDVLILRNCPSEPKLRHVLARYGRAMGEGAMVVLCTPSFSPFRSSLKLRALFAEHGLHLTHRSKRLSDGMTLHVAHRCTVPVCATPAPTRGLDPSTHRLAAVFNA